MRKGNEVIMWKNDKVMMLCGLLGALASLPTAKADCSNPAPGDVVVTDWGYGDRRWLADVNGDGKADYCRGVGNYVGDDSFFGCSLSIASSGALDILTPVNDWGYEDRRWLTDVNGDGTADYCRAVGNFVGEGSFLGCSLSITSSGALDILVPIGDWGYDDRRWFADVNGDGSDDFCRAVGESSGANSFMACSLQIVSSGAFDTQVVMPDWGGGVQWRWMADIDGDGKADYCRNIDDESGSYLMCSTDIISSADHDTMRHFGDWGYGYARWLVDANGDGKADLCRAVGNWGGNDSWLACSFAAASSDPNIPEWDSLVPIENWGQHDRRWLTDVTGDGKAEIARAVDDGMCSYFRHASAVPDGCTPEGLELIDLVNDYRAEHGLPAIAASPSLCTVASTHVHDLSDNEPHKQPGCNSHSWSDQGAWSDCCYTPDHAQAQCMWEKPAELTTYPGKGYENAAWGVNSPAHALDIWKSSPGHNGVILNIGQWANYPWQAIGADVYQGYAVLWFGVEPDPAG